MAAQYLKGISDLSTDKGLYFVLTRPCVNWMSGDPCDLTLLGVRERPESKSAISPHSSRSWSVGKRIVERMDPTYYRKIDGVIYIYTAPCLCLVATALAIAETAGPDAEALLRFLVRPDDRLISSCCSNTDRSIGLVSLLEKFREYELHSSSSLKNLERIDKVWIERWLFEIEETDEVQDTTNVAELFGAILQSHESPKSCAGIVLLGELEYCLPIMHCHPLPLKPRIPREAEVYQMVPSFSSSPWTRKYLGTYTPQPLPTSATISRKSIVEASPRDPKPRTKVPFTSTLLDTSRATGGQISPPPSPASKRYESSASSLVSEENLMPETADNAVSERQPTTGGAGRYS